MASPHSKRIGEDATSTRSRHAPTVGGTGWLRRSTISRPTSGSRDQNANSMPAAAKLPAGEVRRTTGCGRRAKMKRVGGQTIGGRLFATGEIAERPAAWPRTTRCPGPNALDVFRWTISDSALVAASLLPLRDAGNEVSWVSRDVAYHARRRRPCQFERPLPCSQSLGSTG